MYKNFNLTDEERKQIMEQHGSFGYKKPKGIVEEIDSDDEEMELNKLYAGDDEDMEDDEDMDEPDFSSAFEDSDDYEDLYDLSVAKQNLPKDKMVDMSRSGPKDIDYNVAQDFYNDIPGMFDRPSEPKQPTSDYYLRTYGTPDPDMESETLADRKKNAPLDFPKYTDKDRRDPENLLSWEQKKALLAQRKEREWAKEQRKRMKWEMGRSRELADKRLAAASLKPGVNESVLRLTESELIELVKNIVKQTTKK
jgi:hypothetical protein